MKEKEFNKQLQKLQKRHEKLTSRINKKVKKNYNGIYFRYKFPVLTADHTPLHWRYDVNPVTNPYLMERIGINSVFNAGAILFNDKFLLVTRIEGWDRKSFFAVAESNNGIDNWKFWDYPITLPETDQPDVNVYDMRLTRHEDGWIYGFFTSERNDSNSSSKNTCVASCGIARTKDLHVWERLPDLVSLAGQQRNVVLHPEFVNGKYAVYTQPQDVFDDETAGNCISWGYINSIEKAELQKEIIIDDKKVHTIKQVMNGQGPPPVKTESGWLHLAHGMSRTAAGIRNVLYLFLTDLKHPEKVIRQPAGYFMSPQGNERVGEVPNVIFSNGWIEMPDGEVFIYYSSAGSRLHVATTSIERLLDYVMNTPEDEYKTGASVGIRSDLISRNRSYIAQQK